MWVIETINSAENRSKVTIFPVQNLDLFILMYYNNSVYFEFEGKGYHIAENSTKIKLLIEIIFLSHLNCTI